MTATMPWRVVKLGGSLLDIAGLGDRLRRWLGAQPAGRYVLIAGGGRLVDVLRDADRLHGIGEQQAHWLCIRAMSITAHLLSALLPEAQVCSSLPELRSRGPEARLSILDPWHFLRAEEPRLVPQPLPARWDVTSDSIAARLADVFRAAELVLLKSALPPLPHTLEHLSAAGYVDDYFPQAAADLPLVRCVNLSADGFGEVRLLSASTR